MSSTVEIVIKGVDQASKAFGSTNKSAAGLHGTVDKLTKIGFVGLATASVAVLAGLAALTAGLVKAVVAATEEQKGVASLAAAVKATGANWDTASQAIERYLASETQRVALDDGKGRESLVRLTTATGDYEKAIGLLPLAIDLAAAKNIDLASAAEIVGKVAQGNTSILTRYGIQLGENVTAEEALIKMHERFAGQGEAFARTYAGQMQILNIHLGNITENIGGMFLPALTRMATAFNNLLRPIEAATNALGPLFAKELDAVAAEVFGHGENIGGQLAQGIINAAPYVLAALMTLRGIISYWLGPGSPPKLLPLLTEWGKAAAEEWFKGWTRGDFGMLRGLTASLQGVLQGMVGEGALKPGGVNPILRALRGQIGAALDELKATGGVSEDTFAAIAAAGGPAGAAAEDLARAYIRVASIQQEMAATTDPERKAALAEQLEIAQGDLELLQFKLGAMTEESSLLERQLDLMKNIAKSSKDIARAIGEIPAALKEGIGVPLSLDFDIEEIERKAEEIRKSIWTKLMGEDGESGPLPKLKQFMQGDFKYVVIGVLTAIGIAAILAFGSWVIAAGPVLLVITGISIAVALLKKAWDENWLGIRTALEAAWEKIRPILEKLSSKLGGIIAKFNEAIEKQRQWREGGGKAIPGTGGQYFYPPGYGLGGGAYQFGGIVPGPIGAAQLAVVHGGELIIPPGRSTERIAEIHHHWNLTINSAATTENLAGDFAMLQAMAG